MVLEIEEEDDEAELSALEAVEVDEFEDTESDKGMFIKAVFCVRFRSPVGEEDDEREICGLLLVGDKRVDAGFDVSSS